MKNLIILIALVATSLNASASSFSSYKKHVYSKLKPKVAIFKKCYQKALDNKGHIKGKKIVFILSIDGTGFLEGIQIPQSFDMSVLRCVNSNVAGMQFNKPPKGKPLKIEVPLNFKINYH